MREDGLTPIDGIIEGGDLGGPISDLVQDVQVHRRRGHFTRADRVYTLASASEADVDTVFMARIVALCSLPRTNPNNSHQYIHRNGP